MTTLTRTPVRPGPAIAVACVALFTDMLVYGLAIPVLPLLPATVTAGPAATGVLFAVYAAATLLVTPLAGRLVDRVGPRTPLLLGLVGLAGATVLFAVGAPYALLLVARALQGAAAGLSWVAGLSLITAVTPVEKRGQWLGLAMSMVSVGVLVGPPLSGILVEHGGPRAPFYLAAAVAALDGVARIALVRRTPRPDDDPAGPVAVLRVPGTASVLGVVVLAAGVIAGIEPVLPLHLSRTQGLGAFGIGLLFAGLVLAGAAANPLVGRQLGRVSARRLVLTGALGTAVALLGVAWAAPVAVIAAAMVVAGLASSLLMAPASTLVGTQGAKANPPALGAAYAVFNLAYAGGLAAGPLLTGGLTGAAGFPVALSVLAVLAVIAGVVATRRLPTGLS